MATTATSRTGRKIAAIAVGALVLGVGATYTLASWTDSEWVWGGATGGAPGIGTQMLEVEQSTDGGGNWNDEENNPGGALNFTAAALELTPGDTVYAPVSLRTKINSIGGDVTLQKAVKAGGITTVDADDRLWNAVELSVYTSSAGTAPACEAGGFVVGDWTSVAGLSAVSLDTPATPTTGAQTLGAATAAAAGAPQHYCFVLHLPEDAQEQAEAEVPAINLMGRTIAPAWEFQAESN